MRYGFAGCCVLACWLGMLGMQPAYAAEAADGVRIAGPGVQPQLGFACCEHDIAQSQAMFSDPAVIGALKELHAEVAIALPDFSPERADLVHRLNSAGIPAIAWLLLPKAQGFYFNADNAPEAASRVAAFEQWTSENHLEWAGVGLDVEPNFAQLSALRRHRWRLLATLVGRAVNGRRLDNAQRAYNALIGDLERRGYEVQTYQMPYVPAERSVGSTLPDRLLGTLELRGSEVYLMLYTSYARMAGAAMIWSLGRNAQGIAVGVTEGEGTPGSGTGPLDWEEFSRDLIVASHYSKRIGIYDLEGCVRQGFLPRLEAMDWSQSVVIPAENVKRATRLGRAVRTVLWIASHFVYLLIAVLVLIALLVWRSRCKAQRRTLQS